MKILITTMLLMVWNLTLAVETCDYSEESNQDVAIYVDAETVYSDSEFFENNTIDEETRLMINLSNHLLDNTDINISVMALSYLSFFYGEHFDPLTDSLILLPEVKAAVLNRTSHSLDVNTSTLLAASFMCENDDMKGLCDADKFNTLLLNQAPDNLITYLRDLAYAVDDMDVEMIEVITEQMSQAKYSRMLNPISTEFIQAVDEYVLEHPVSDSIKQTMKDVLFSEEKSSDMDSVIYQYILTMYGMTSVSYLPRISPLYEACSEFLVNNDHCLVIADILTEKSDTFLMTYIGYGLKEKTLEITGDTKALVAVQAENEAFKAYLMCLTKNQSIVGGSFESLDPEMMSIINQGSHEGKSFELAALYLYNKYQKAEVEGLVDPQSCGLKYVE